MQSLLRFLLLFFISFSFAQTEIISEDTQVSILTFGPGQNLNDAFGHNAIRFHSRFSDIVYDFGRFDFDAPNFYLKFAQGKLNYLQGKEHYKTLIGAYINSNRTIKEQVLNLSFQDKKDFYAYLENNYKKDQGAYLYDFFYDNCATRVRDITETTLKGNLEYKQSETYKPQTFRALIYEHVHWNTWGSFGIDIALGSVIDRDASLREQMYLPEKMNHVFESATIKDTGEKLVTNSKTIYEEKKRKNNNTFLLSPIFILGIVALLILFITYKDNKNKTRTKILDLIIFSITGLVGVLIFLLWFATDHTATANNYNLLWAFPLSLFCIIQLLKEVPKKWFIAYIKFSILMLCLLMMHWVIGVQRFAPALLPILIALVIRYVFLLRHYKLAK